MNTYKYLAAIIKHYHIEFKCQQNCECINLMFMKYKNKCSVFKLLTFISEIFWNLFLIHIKRDSDDVYTASTYLHYELCVILHICNLVDSRMKAYNNNAYKLCNVNDSSNRGSSSFLLKIQSLYKYCMMTLDMWL